MEKSNTLERGKIPYEEFDRIIGEYNGDPTAIIAILQDIQEKIGFVPKDGIPYLAEKLGVSAAKIYGIVTFYAQFRLQPLGKYIITLCQGTACHVNGAKLVSKAITEELGIKEGETTKDGLFTLEKVACIGCCSLSPVMLINEDTHAKLTPDSVRKILKEYQKREEVAQN